MPGFYLIIVTRAGVPMNKPIDDTSQDSLSSVLTGRSCRFAASLFNIGNIVAVLFPPIGLLWLALSMVIYAMNRHHPNEKVGEYTQRAAYLIYGVTGLIVAVAIFIPKNGLNYYLGIWALAALIVVPVSIFNLVRIHRDEWCDTEIPTVSNHD